METGIKIFLDSSSLPCNDEKPLYGYYFSYRQTISLSLDNTVYWEA